MPDNALRSRWLAADAEDHQQDHRVGTQAANEWVNTVGHPGGFRPRFVKGLRRMTDDSQYDLNDWLSIFTNGMNNGIAEGLYGFLVGQEHPDPQDVKSFWHTALGDEWERIEEPDYARGFVEGVLDLAALIEQEASVRAAD